MRGRRIGAVLGVALALACLPLAAGSASAPVWSAPAVIYDTSLLGVSCASSSFCVAVGYTGRALTWDGSSWSQPADVDGVQNLEAASCPSASFCAAVDEHGGAVTWDGSAWSPPADIDGTDELFSVSCASASFCVAVGSNGTAVTWDGHAWGAPADIDAANALYGVSCTSASFCTAVDYAHALRWNGSTWSAPVVIDPPGNLGSVSCASATECVAVELFSGYAMTWNGSAWTAPADIDGAQRLEGVSCASASFCVAVAAAWMAITWNGGSWSPPAGIPSVPNVGLTSVSCVSSAFCAAVGNGGEAALYGGGAPATPVLARTVAAARVSGTVRVRRPGTSAFVALSGSALIPVGSVVDATSGHVRLTAAGTGTTTHTGVFYAGEFELRQARSGATDLTLTGGAACPAHVARSSAPPAARHRRALWGDAHGSFTTSGIYADAAELGTRWLTKDTCAGTLIRVTQGTVRVTDLVTHRSFRLSAPRRYLARP